MAELVKTAEAQPSAGIVGAVLLDEGDSGRIQNAGHSFGRRTGRHREIARGRNVESIGSEAYVVDAVSGGALLAKRAVFEAVGLLDEALFLYFEDMDLCLRAGKVGFGVLAAPTARVRHRGAASVGEASPLTTYYSVRNHMAVAHRHSRGLGLLR